MWRVLLPALGLAVSSSRAVAAPEGVSAPLLSASGASFTVRVPEPRLTPVAGTGFTRLELPGYDPSTPPGTPSLPARIVHVAVPPRGEVSVHITAAATRSFD